MQQRTQDQAFKGKRGGAEFTRQDLSITTRRYSLTTYMGSITNANEMSQIETKLQKKQRDHNCVMQQRTQDQL